MQTLKNDFSIVKRKSFQFYSLNLQLSSSETPYHVCLDPNTAHRSTPLQLAEWTYTDVKKHRFEKAAVNSASLSERSSNTDQGPSQGTATHWWAKKKMLQTSSYRVHQQISDALKKQQCSLTLNALQWRVSFSTAANHTLQMNVNWHPSVCTEKREPLAKSINSCNSILCLRAHKGSHKHCQIILHGPILYFSSICAADIQEFCSCLAMTQLIPTYEGHGPHRLLPRDLKLMNGDTTLLWD